MSDRFGNLSPEGLDAINPWEQLQDVLMWVHNRRVVREFRDVAPENETWIANLSTPRSRLRLACTIRDTDTAIMCQLRMWLFYVICGQASDFHPPLYTMPTDRYQQSVQFAPQVTLYFREDIEDVEPGYSPIDAEISFRIKNENYNTFTPANAQTLANKIRTEFATGRGYVWRKGRVKLTYRRKEQGYQFSVNAFNEAEGVQVINKVLDLQNDTLDREFLTVSEFSQNPPIVPGQEFIYGQTRRRPRRRPVGNVRFRYAEVHIWGVQNAITLVDMTGRRRNALIIA
ncbi:hypothetical protein HNI00_07275 [Thermoleptolyngbya oregonensis NK1-22]|uniref:Uncharacterized protein n=1 Tax=Thermoleptolyngbya oregonensis NK1-22 TaxID=2547457 RepID=A0AA96Y1Z8_9CYAN|nr:hypothetical protein [Thermoleptolyngbya oregonensis]WOB42977.1 hypothetical protein HNI00_07275 [Thermoleptolyngbya oregonensis NK1-22]